MVGTRRQNPADTWDLNRETPIRENDQIIGTISYETNRLNEERETIRDSDGTIKRTLHTRNDGTKVMTTYENGEPHTVHTELQDGTVDKRIYDNGDCIFHSIIAKNDNTITETEYDPSGNTVWGRTVTTREANRTSETVYLSDDTVYTRTITEVGNDGTQITTHYSGDIEAKCLTVKRPNGDTEYTEEYLNGPVYYRKNERADGSYEMYEYENSVTTRELKVDAHGNRTDKQFRPDGTLISDSRTEVQPDGTHKVITTQNGQTTTNYYTEDGENVTQNYTNASSALKNHSENLTSEHEQAPSPARGTGKGRV